MARKDPRDIDPDDFFADTRMTFGEHIEDLRRHLLRAIYWFLFFLFLSFFIGKHVLAFIARPVEKQLQAFYDRRLEATLKKIGKDSDVDQVNQGGEWNLIEIPASQMKHIREGQLKEANAVEKPAADSQIETVRLWFRHPEVLRVVAGMQKAQQLVGKRPALTTLSVQEAFMVYLKVCIVTGLVVGSPFIFWEIWSFIAAGLYPHEKRYVNFYGPFSVVLFIIGVLVCEFLVIPKAIEALLWFNEWIGLEPDLRLNEWLGFAIMMPVIFGISFQTPLVMLFLERIGVASVQFFKDQRRLIWFLMAVFAAVITPSTDPYSMLFLWVPMCLLFELGIFLCMLGGSREIEEEVPESEELIEV